MDAGALLDLLGNENRRRILRLLARKPCYVTEISEHLGVSPKAVIDHLRKLEDAGLIESRTDDQRRKYFHISRNVRLEVTVAPYGFATKSAYPASPNLDLSSCQHLKIQVSRRGVAGTGANGEVEGADVEGADVDGDSPGSEDGAEPAEVDGGATATVETGAETDADAPVEADASAVDAGAGAKAEADAADRGEGDDPDGGEAEGAAANLEVGPAEIAELADEVNELEDLERELSLAQRWVQGRIAGVLDSLAESVDDDNSYLHAELIVTVAGGTTDVDAISRELEVPPEVVEDCLDRLRDRGILRRTSGEWQFAR